MYSQNRELTLYNPYSLFLKYQFLKIIHTHTHTCDNMGLGKCI